MKSYCVRAEGEDRDAAARLDVEEGSWKAVNQKDEYLLLKAQKWILTLEQPLDWASMKTSAVFVFPAASGWNSVLTTACPHHPPSMFYSTLTTK